MGNTAISSGKGSKHWASGTEYWKDDSPTTQYLKKEAIAKASPEALAFLGELATNHPGPIIEVKTKEDGRVDLSPEGQQARRKTHLGGSDLASVFGVSRFTSRLELFYMKTGKKPRLVDNDPMRDVILAYGHACEDVCAQAWAIRYPEWDIRADETIYNHPRYPFLSANLDRIIRGEDGCWMVGEIKCPVVQEAERMWWKDNEDLLDYQKQNVPEEYELQVRLYMAILDIWQARFAVMLSPTRILYRVVYRDLDKEAALLKGCINFWENHVLKGVPPEANGDEKDGVLALDAAKRYAPTPQRNRTIKLPASLQDTAVEILELQAQSTELTKQENALKNKLSALKAKVAIEMRDSVEGYIDCPNGLTIQVMYKPQKGRQSVDFDKLKEDYPDAYASCVTTPEEGPRPVKVKYL